MTLASHQCLKIDSVSLLNLKTEGPGMSWNNKGHSYPTDDLFKAINSD
ncbi:MAG: hypothetical protein ACI909_004237 [Planctomycetota bacterium]|jgi:hypothetical protein